MGIACRALAAWVVVALAGGCLGGAPGPHTCRIEVVGLESESDSAQGYDVEYRVRGYAGTEGVVSLAARRPDGTYVAGKGVQVGPGAFVAVVDQKLTARAAGYTALLEIANSRCRADVQR